MKKAYEAIELKKEKIKNLESLAKALKAGKELKGSLKQFAGEKGIPKTSDACKQAVSKLQETVEKDELKAQNREDNKSVALGTSRINYMDPRITISWCKKKEVPIEKIFQSTLQAKFAWAMDNEPEWKF